jgi:hypothetical protein
MKVLPYFPKAESSKNVPGIHYRETGNISYHLMRSQLPKKKSKIEIHRIYISPPPT